MDVQEEDALSNLFIENISKSKSCLFCMNVNCGTKLIAILAITVLPSQCVIQIISEYIFIFDDSALSLNVLFGFTCAVMLLIRDRKNLTATTLILIVFLAIFVIITVLFVLVSVMLLMAALDESIDLMSYYIWLSIVYLCVQLVLAIIIPLLLIIEGRYPVAIALIWMVIVMIVGLGWTHFISVVSSYRTNLLSIGDY